ncbi:protein phosphatase CheZ [Candidatus Symbiobacter mobilis]|nr:protein phosphatase CheZ [Candidatus Symbiobacter mobilis]
MHESAEPASSQTAADFHDVHLRLGSLTRQLHDSLNGLGLTDKVRTWAGELPDAKSRLSYIARLTGEAAEKVLNSVDQAKVHHDHIAEETRRIGALLAADPAAAVAQGHVAQFVAEVDRTSREIDQNLTDIMMAQDFHDLTGQVITRVVSLAANIEEQLVQLLIVTAPPEAQGIPAQLLAKSTEHALDGPVVNAANRTDVVQGQSEVDDLLASLGF